ncbi:MAG TPA: hypothetical protein VEU62_07440 [Bryobacterales bacterium]|nr:hypothetical protein [Bryobacterales bacterium]
MSVRSKNLFAVEFPSIAGKGLFASGGLKFQDDEPALRRQYGFILKLVPLDVLLGEAALWVLWPSTVAIWVFPLLLWPLAIDRAVLAAIAVFLAVQIAHMLFYAQRLNYAVFVLGNRALQAAVYAVCALLFWHAGAITKIIALAAWLLLMATGILQVIFVVPFLPLLKYWFARRPADQALRNVVRHHARRAGLRWPTAASL